MMRTFRLAATLCCFSVAIESFTPDRTGLLGMCSDRSFGCSTTDRLLRSALVASFTITKRATVLFSSKWDNLDDDDDDDLKEMPNTPKDMMYVEFNLMRQNKHFKAIRGAGGVELTNDVYVRDPQTDTFWFTGKIARISDVSIEMAIARQWPLIEEHAVRLRPLELFPTRGSLEIWTAPGDSELDVAYNRPHIQFQKMKREVEGGDGVKAIEVGFQGEIYENDEEGFRTERTEDGRPAKPEIQSPPPQGISS